MASSLVIFYSLSNRKKRKEVRLCGSFIVGLSLWSHLYLRLYAKPTQDEGLRALSFFYWNAVRVGGVLASVRINYSAYSRKHGIYSVVGGNES